MEDHPTNGELALMIGSVKEVLDLHKADSAKRDADAAKRDSDILTQTVKTNGRVGVLEERAAVLKGGLIVITFLVIPIILDIVRRYVLKP